jgi:hypothetical protein
MLFDLVGFKIMTVYVAEIKGRGIAAFHANNGSDAERLLRDRVFRDDLMVLATGGLPLWDGVTDIEVRLAPPTRRQNGGHHAPKRSARAISRRTMSDGSLSSLHSPTDETVINLARGSPFDGGATPSPDLVCVRDDIL